MFNEIGPNVFQPASSGTVYDTLPVGSYDLGYNQNQGFYLVQTQNPKQPTKIYGAEHNQRAQRIINAYKRFGSVGVLLSGVPGSGKTVLMNSVALDFIQMGLPVININLSMWGPGIVSFIHESLADQKCMICIDELEKRLDVNDSEQVAAILQLLDGPKKNNKCFCMTVNDASELPAAFRNRPSRIRYVMQYDELSPDVVESVVADYLNDQSLFDETVLGLMRMNELTFDVVTQICSEVNFTNNVGVAFSEFNVGNASTNDITYAISSVQDSKGRKVSFITDYSFDPSYDNLVVGAFVEPEHWDDPHAIELLITAGITEYDPRRHGTTDKNNKFYDSDPFPVKWAHLRIDWSRRPEFDRSRNMRVYTYPSGVHDGVRFTVNLNRVKTYKGAF